MACTKSSAGDVDAVGECNDVVIYTSGTCMVVLWRVLRCDSLDTVCIGMQ